MPEYDPTFYGRNWAEVYDAFFPLPDEKDCIECLAALAGRGPILELGIGSGRVALPLARRNVEVHGIEASPEMVTKLRAKPGGNDLLVHIGDFVDVAVQGEYPLIFAIFNTLLCVTSQNDQVRCLVNVAQHLSADGILVIEAGLPMSESGRGIQVHELRADRVTLLVHQLDHVTQQLAQQTILIANGMIRLIPDRYRFIWPSELDLMANIAGLRLRERWGDWRRGPFTSSSAKHISVYESARR